MKRKKVGLLFFALAAAFAGWIAWDNARIVVTNYTVKSAALPKEFDGFRIAQVSDLHNDEFGEENARLVARLKKLKPDMIAITGDLLDSRRTDVQKALCFVKQAVQIAPCYYVTGNHESRRAEYEELEAEMLAAGVIVLRDESTTLAYHGETITVAGMEDPSFYLADGSFKTVPKEVHKAAEALLGQQEGFVLLLSHRPELFDVYCQYEVDVALTGHVHGGQFRIPFFGGVAAPNQGFFQKYDAGVYRRGKTSMVLSRGLGQSIFPFRLNNPPELVVVELKAEPSIIQHGTKAEMLIGCV